MIFQILFAEVLEDQSRPRPRSLIDDALQKGDADHKLRDQWDRG